MDPPYAHSHSSSYDSFPILAISILGILTTAILLLSYYLFVVKCCLHWRRTDLLLPFRSHRIRRRIDSMRRQYPTESRGLDSVAIRSIPTLRFAKAGPIECAVCLSEFEDQELLRILPGCKHSFHIDCIDTWLQSSANCPLCRLDISRVPISSSPYPYPNPNTDLVIEVDNANDGQNTVTTTAPKASKSRRFWHVASKGDEWIDISRVRDERFTVQPMRRSFSMDSSNDRSLFLAVQEILRQNRNLRSEGSSGEGSSSGSGRIRRSFFSFGRSSRSTSAVLPVQSESC